MSLELLTEMRAALGGLPNYVERTQAQPVSVEHPSWQIVYRGRHYRGTRLVNSWWVEVWAGRADVPDAQTRLQVVVTEASGVLHPIKCLLIGGFVPAVEAAGVKGIPMIMARCEVEEI